MSMTYTCLKKKNTIETQDSTTAAGFGGSASLSASLHPHFTACASLENSITALFYSFKM